MNPEVRRVLAKACLVATVVIPIGALAYGIFALWDRRVDTTDLVLLACMYVATSIGINIGYHRMLAHKSFDAPAPVRFTFLALGSMAFEMGCLDWAAAHAKHHAHGDRPGDPHSPLDGFWHAHVGWLFSHGVRAEPQYYRPFQGDRVAEFIHATFWYWAFLGLALPALIGGWSGLVWGGLVRIFFNHHVIWSVNSICHTFGRQPFPTTDRSKNEWIISLVSLGEGWHNNHHAFPGAAYHGFRWWQFDPSGYLIRFLAALRLARNVHRVPRAIWERQRRKGPVSGLNGSGWAVPAGEDQA